MHARVHAVRQLPAGCTAAALDERGRGRVLQGNGLRGFMHEAAGICRSQTRNVFNWCTSHAFCCVCCTQFVCYCSCLTCSGAGRLPGRGQGKHGPRRAIRRLGLPPSPPCRGSPAAACWRSARPASAAEQALLQPACRCCAVGRHRPSRPPHHRRHHRLRIPPCTAREGDGMHWA